VNGVAQRLALALEPFLRGPIPVRLVAWDGSATGPADGSVPTVELRSPDAVRRLLWHPGAGPRRPTSPVSSTCPRSPAGTSTRP